MTKSTEGWDWSRRSERRDFWWDSSETTGCTVNLLIRVGRGGEGIGSGGEGIGSGREGIGRGGEGIRSGVEGRGLGGEGRGLGVEGSGGEGIGRGGEGSGGEGRGLGVEWRGGDWEGRGGEGRGGGTIQLHHDQCDDNGSSHLKPQLLTERVSVLNFHRRASPTTRTSWGHSARSLPEHEMIEVPMLSTIESTSERLCVPQRGSNSTLKDSAPGM